MPSDDFERTHTLLSDDYVDALQSLVAALAPHATSAVARLDEREAETAPDGEACRETWDAVGDQFERAPDADASGREAWRVDLRTENGDGFDALSRVVGLANGVAGRHFVFEVELRCDGQTAFGATPHHSSAGVDADALPTGAFESAESALAELDACLVADEFVAEWVARDRRWRVGPSVCKETLDGTRASCYGVSNLRGVAVAADGTTLELTWGLGGPISEDPIGRALSWAVEKAYRPPERLPCGDDARAERVADFLAETLRRFDGREIRTE